MIPSLNPILQRKKEKTAGRERGMEKQLLLPQVVSGFLTVDLRKT